MFERGHGLSETTSPNEPNAERDRIFSGVLPNTGRVDRVHHAHGPSHLRPTPVSATNGEPTATPSAEPLGDHVQDHDHVQVEDGLTSPETDLPPPEREPEPEQWPTAAYLTSDTLRSGSFRTAARYFPSSTTGGGAPGGGGGALSSVGGSLALRAPPTTPAVSTAQGGGGGLSLRAQDGGPDTVRPASVRRTAPSFAQSDAQRAAFNDKLTALSRERATALGSPGHGEGHDSPAGIGSMLAQSLATVPETPSPMAAAGGFLQDTSARGWQLNDGSRGSAGPSAGMGSGGAAPSSASAPGPTSTPRASAVKYLPFDASPHGQPPVSPVAYTQTLTPRIYYVNAGAANVHVESGLRRGMGPGAGLDTPSTIVDGAGLQSGPGSPSDLDHRPIRTEILPAPRGNPRLFSYIPPGNEAQWVAAEATTGGRGTAKLVGSSASGTESAKSSGLRGSPAPNSGSTIGPGELSLRPNTPSVSVHGVPKLKPAFGGVDTGSRVMEIVPSPSSSDVASGSGRKKQSFIKKLFGHKFGNKPREPAVASARGAGIRTAAAPGVSGTEAAPNFPGGPSSPASSPPPPHAPAVETQTSTRPVVTYISAASPDETAAGSPGPGGLGVDGSVEKASDRDLTASPSSRGNATTPDADVSSSPLAVADDDSSSDVLPRTLSPGTRVQG